MGQVSDSQAATQARAGLRAWHNAALAFPENYDMTLDELIQFIQSTNKVWMVNFGKSYILAQQHWDDSGVDQALADMATKNQGKVGTYPDGTFRGAEFFDVLVGNIQNWNVSRISRFTAQTVIEGSQKIAEVGTVFAGVSLTSTLVVALIGLYVVITSYKKA